MANVPARYQAFEVRACPPARSAIDARIARREAELATLRAANPRPRLWKKFETPRFGAGRNVRFGDLDGDGALDMLFAQNIPRIQGDTFDHISALTAVTLDGRVLWQSGRPDPRNGLLTNDTPFQIHDVDGDGRDELFIGHSLWDHAGRRRWSLGGKLQDHVDAVAVGSFGADATAAPRVYWSSSDEAFVMLDLQGNVLKQVRVGHTQTAAVGRFREGGMIDGRFRRVVVFPDDGHPDLTSAVLDLTGDPRDEIVLWDTERVA